VHHARPDVIAGGAFNIRCTGKLGHRWGRLLDPITQRRLALFFEDHAVFDDFNRRRVRPLAKARAALRVRLGRGKAAIFAEPWIG